MAMPTSDNPAPSPDDSEACSHICSRHRAPPIFDSIPSLDLEIHHLWDLLIPVQRRRNALLKFSCLPFDIRRRIFHLCTSPASTVAQITLSHVCWSWRNDTLGDPLLWDTIRICNAGPSVEKCLEYHARTQTAPIRLEYDQFRRPMFGRRRLPREDVMEMSENMGTTTDAIISFLEHAAQIRELSLLGSTSWYRQHLEPRLLANPISLHQLESLEIVSHEDMRNNGQMPEDAYPPPVSIESLMLGPRISGRLRRLTLNDVTLSWSRSLDIAFRSLTYFCLGGGPNREGQPALMQEDEWLDVLMSLPALIHLDLSVNMVPSITVRPSPRIFLPSLAKLHVMGPTHRCLQFLKAIKLPQNLCLMHSNPYTTEEDFNQGPAASRELASFINETFYGEECAEQMHFIVQFESDIEEATEDVGVWAIGPQVCLKSQRRRFHLGLSGTSPEFAKGFVAHLATNTLARVSALHVRMLWSMSGTEEDAVRSWQTLLSGMPNVHDVYVTLTAAHSVLAGENTLPAASVLHLYDFSRVARYYGPDPPNLSAEEESELLDVLERRSSTLQEVHLDPRASLSDDGMSRLHNIGMEVIIAREEDCRLSTEFPHPA